MSTSSTKNPLITPIYKYYLHLLSICMNASLSAFFVGYSLVYVGSLLNQDFEQAIIKDYGFNDLNWNGDGLYKAVINGVLPVGAIGGALLSAQVIRLLSRRFGFLVTNIPAFLSIVLMVYIKNPYTFLLMRLIQGICTGIYSAIVPLYINEIVTPDCTNLGSLNQIFIAFAQFFCFLLSFLLEKTLSDTERQKEVASTTWKIIAEFPLIIIAIQTIIFIFVFPYQTPKYLYQKGQRQKAANLITLIYRQQHTEQALARYQGTPSITQQQTQFAVRSELVGVQNPIGKLSNVRIAVFFAIHLALLQQMCGVNAIAVYGKNTMEEAIGKEAVGLASLGLSGAPFISAILTIKLMNIRGRKSLIQIGTLVCALCLAAVSVSFLLKSDKPYNDSVPESITIIIGMCIFMAVFGLTLGPIVWLYIPEIVEPNIIPYSTMANLLGASACMIGFPLITDPKVKFIPFLFFFGWCGVALGINWKVMVETRNKSRQKIFQEFRSKRLC